MTIDLQLTKRTDLNYFAEDPEFRAWQQQGHSRPAKVLGNLYATLRCSEDTTMDAYVHGLDDFANVAYIMYHDNVCDAHTAVTFLNGLIHDKWFMHSTTAPEIEIDAESAQHIIRTIDLAAAFIDARAYTYETLPSTFPETFNEDDRKLIDLVRDLDTLSRRFNDRALSTERVQVVAMGPDEPQVVFFKPTDGAELVCIDDGVHERARLKTTIATLAKAGIDL